MARAAKSPLASLRGASTDAAKRRRKDVADRATIELIRHSVADELLVYPQVDEKVSAEEAERARTEHAEAGRIGTRGPFARRSHADLR